MSTVISSDVIAIHDLLSDLIPIYRELGLFPLVQADIRFFDDSGACVDSIRFIPDETRSLKDALKRSPDLVWSVSASAQAAFAEQLAKRSNHLGRSNP